MKKRNAWFIPYHIYSMSTEYSPRFVRLIGRDLELAVKYFDVNTVIVEDYYYGLRWGAYTDVWCPDNLRAMVRIANDLGIDVLLYIDATELSETAPIFNRKGRLWGARNILGRLYTGYSSVLYPTIYFSKKYDWFTRIMCPASGWRNYLKICVRTLLEKYPISGIYIDRIDYRIRCYNTSHGGGSNHFAESIPYTVSEIKKEVKRISDKNILVVNDSCLPPDIYHIRSFKHADGILSEMLPTDMSPESPAMKMQLYSDSLIRIFARPIRSLMNMVIPKFYSDPRMADPGRIRYIIKRLNRAAPGKFILLFNHRTDFRTFSLISELAEGEPSVGICIYAGRLSLVNYIEILNRFR